MNEMRGGTLGRATASADSEPEKERRYVRLGDSASADR